MSNEAMATCRLCGRDIKVTRRGTLQRHRGLGGVCAGSFAKPEAQRELDARLPLGDRVVDL